MGVGLWDGCRRARPTASTSSLCLLEDSQGEMFSEVYEES